MHGPVVLVAQLDQVVQIGAAAVHPVADVVHVGELGMRASREATTFVTPTDLQPLSIARVVP